MHSLGSSVSVATSTVSTLHRRVVRAVSLQYLDCLGGVVFPVAPISATEPRIRDLRRKETFNLMLRRDRLGRFWFRSRRHFVLLHAILARTADCAGERLPFDLQEAARQSGLSEFTIGAMLKQARETGDLVIQPAPQDRRRLLIEVSPALNEYAEQHRLGFYDAAAALHGRANAQPRLTPAADAAARRLNNLLVLTMTRDPPHLERRFSTPGFSQVMWALVDEGPQRLAGFIGPAAKQVGVTEQTIRNIVAWLRSSGWLEAGDPLTVTAMGRERLSRFFGAMAARWQAMLDILDMMAEMPELAAELDQGVLRLRSDMARGRLPVLEADGSQPDGLEHRFAAG